MGALSRPYGRRVRPLNLTPVPHWAAVLTPLLLTVILISLAARLFTRTQILFIKAAQENGNVQSTEGLTIKSFVLASDDLSLFRPEVRRWENQIFGWAEKYDLPPTLVAIVMQIESCGAPDVVSSAGAIGLFQVMPFHFSTTENPFDPEVNATRGLAYLARSSDIANGSIDKTLAGYNGGHSVIDWNPLDWPEETRRYVRWGAGIWEDLQAGNSQSNTLDAWLAAGGEQLCYRARQSNVTH